MEHTEQSDDESVVIDKSLLHKESNVRIIDLVDCTNVLVFDTRHFDHMLFCFLSGT